MDMFYIYQASPGHETTVQKSMKSHFLEEKMIRIILIVTWSILVGGKKKYFTPIPPNFESQNNRPDVDDSIETTVSSKFDQIDEFSPTGTYPPGVFPYKLRNIDYLARGYNIFKGDPLEPIEDPGFVRGLVIDLNYENNIISADGSLLLPSNVTANRLLICDESSYSEEITTEKGFQKSLSEFVEIGAGGQYRKIGAEFSAGKSFQETTKGIRGSQNVYFSSSSVCLSYRATNIGAPISSYLKKKILSIPLNGSREEIVKSMKNLLDDCGTHYIETALFGSTITNQAEISMQSYQELKQKNININAAASASFGDVFKASVRYNKASTSEEAKSFRQAVSKTKVTTRGSLPPSDGLWETWAESVQTSDPYPIKITLRPIIDLLNPSLLPEFCPFKLEKRKQLINEFQEEYCLKHVSNCRPSEFGINKVYSKVMIALGNFRTDEAQQYINDMEIIDLASPNSNCTSIEHFPFYTNFSGIGLGFQERPLICGGSKFPNVCLQFIDGTWETYFPLREGRPSCVMINSPFRDDDSKLFLTGGNLNSTELLTPHGWELSVPLPVKIRDHCMATVNSTTVMVIGGYQNDEPSANTFLFNSETNIWTEGPALAHPRFFHSCGSIRKNRTSSSTEKCSIVVGGHYDPDITKPENYTSVEVLELNSTLAWRIGPQLPGSISILTLSAMVNDPSGGVVMIGGYKNSDSSKMFLRLQHSTAEWEELEINLKKNRQGHVAILIPDDVVYCS